LTVVSPWNHKHTWAKAVKVFGNNNKIKIPDYLKDRIIENISISKFVPFYVGLKKEGIELFYDRLEPLLESGKILYRPYRTLWKLIDEKKGVSEGNIDVFPIDFLSTNDNWEISDFYSNQKVLHSINFSKDSIYREQVEISIPYITNISIQDFNKILDDENDTLLNLRSALKQLIVNVKNKEGNHYEIKRDLIDPEIEKLKRQFTLISRIHKFKVAGATVLSTSALLISLFDVTPISGLYTLLGLGAGTSGFIRNEADYQEKLAKLKDNPYYLLWKLKK